MLEVNSVAKVISSEFSLTPISFHQKEKEKLALMGISGSGKTTLLNLIAGRLQPDSGTIFLNEVRVKGPHEQLIPGHPGLALLEQSSHLPHHYYIKDLFQYANVWDAPKLKELQEICRVSHLLNRKHYEISGGERQRIALALLLVTSPAWILLDEPFSHLDLSSKRILEQVLLDAGEYLHITYLMCTHNPEDIFGWADRVLIIENGKLIQTGSPKEVYESPKTNYVAGLLGDFFSVPQHVASNFFSKKEMPSICQNWMVRPEQVVFHSEQIANAIPCVIRDVIFAGRSYKVKVDVMEASLFFYAEHGDWQIGSRGFISIRKGWCIDEAF